MDPVEMCERAAERTGKVVAGVRADQLGGPTPCTEWDTRMLLNHIIGGNYMFATLGAGESIDMSQPLPDFSSDDPSGHYERSAKGALAGFSSPGAMERIYPVPMGRFLARSRSCSQ